MSYEPAYIRGIHPLCQVYIELTILDKITPARGMPPAGIPQDKVIPATIGGIVPGVAPGLTIIAILPSNTPLFPEFTYINTPERTQITGHIFSSQANPILTRQITRVSTQEITEVISISINKNSEIFPK